MASQKTKSILIIGDKSVIIDEVDPELGEETEIVAHVTIAKEGGWGWVVIAGAFFNLFIIDGIVASFGSLLISIATGLSASVSVVSLVNAIAIAVYYLASPFASSLANRFGFRATAMIGSTICVLSCFTAFWVNHIIYLCIFYGLFTGFGFSLISLSSNLVVNFYFEKFRAIAMAITTTGSSFGVATFGVLNKIVDESDGWATVILMHSILIGLVFFSSMTFKPIVTVTVKKAGPDLETCRTVTVLPTTKSTQGIPTKSNVHIDKVNSLELQATLTEKVFGASRNVNYPTSAAVINAPHTSETTQPDPSSSKGEEIYELTTYKPGEPSQTHMTRDLTAIQSLNQLQAENKLIPPSPPKDKTPDKKPSTTSSRFVSDRFSESGEQKRKAPGKKKKCKCLCCKWKPEVDEARPLYRDDVFYHGNVSKLPEYQKSMLIVEKEEDTKLKYALEVSRAAGAVDLQEKRGILTTAMRRVLASMLDVSLLKFNSYKLLCFSSLSLCIGNLIPYVYLPTWASTIGISPQHCHLFIGVMGISAAIGKFFWGLLASKLKAIRLGYFSQLFAGIALCGVTYVTTVYFLYANCVIYGFCISSISSLRYLILVDLYGLGKLTNAIGIILVSNGIGSLLGSPVAGVLIQNFSYRIGFFFGGGFILFASFLLLIADIVSMHEKRKVIKL